MTSAHCGTNWSKKKGKEGLAAFPIVFSTRFAIFTTTCIRVPMLHQLRVAIFHCATFPVIAQTMFVLPIPLPILNLTMNFSGTYLTTLSLAVATFHDKSRKQASSKDPPLAKLETALRAPQPLHLPYRFTPAHVSQMRLHHA